MRKEPAVRREVCGSNVPRNDGVGGDELDEIGSGRQAVACVSAIDKISEAGAQLVVTLDGWYTSHINSLASHCQVLEALW